jgi:acyl phosphate:glycerol-3-phosphate acyltransferase
VSPFLLVPLAYLAGSLPTSLWVGKALHGIDLRTVGSGNLGATNAFRVLGWKTAVLVLTVDVLKGWLPTWLFPRIDSPAVGWAWVIAYASAAVLGHVYSVWARFRGGKGVATSAGALVALAPWAVLGSALVWGLTVFLTRTVSLASILSALLLPAAVILTPHQGGATLSWFALALAAFVIWAHRANLGRLLRGEELRFGGPQPPLRESSAEPEATNGQKGRDE